MRVQGDLPYALSVQVLQAPLSWIVPVSKHTPFRPPFRVAVDVTGASSSHEGVNLTPQLVSEGEAKNSMPLHSPTRSHLFIHT